MGKSVLCAGSCLRLFDVCVWSMRAISKKYSRASGYRPVRRGRAAVTRELSPALASRLHSVTQNCLNTQSREYLPRPAQPFS